MKLLTFAALTLLSFSGAAADASKFCVNVGYMDEPVCSVSMSMLLARGEDFDGKIVEVTGYLAYAELPVLFSSKETFQIASLADGIAVVMPKNKMLAAKLWSLDHSTVQIIGRFSAAPVDATRYGHFHTSGRLTEVSSAGSGFIPWGYAVPVPYDMRGAPK